MMTLNWAIRAVYYQLSASVITAFAMMDTRPMTWSVCLLVSLSVCAWV